MENGVQPAGAKRSGCLFEPHAYSACRVHHDGHRIGQGDDGVSKDHAPDRSGKPCAQECDLHAHGKHSRGHEERQEGRDFEDAPAVPAV